MISKNHTKKIYIGQKVIWFFCVDRALVALAFPNKSSFEKLPGGLQVYPGEER